MLTGRLVTQAVLVVSAVIIPRVLGVDLYGQYAAVMAVIVMVQTISSFGLPMVEIRELPPLLSSPDSERGRILGSTIWLTRMVLSILSGAAAYVWLGGLDDLVVSDVILPLAALAVLRGAYEASASQLLPLGRVRAYVTLDFLRATLALGVVVVAFRVTGIDGVFRWFGTVFLVLFLFASLLLRRTLPLRPWSARWGSLRPHLGYSLAVFVGELSVVAQAQFVIFIIAIRIGRTEAGIVAMALQLQAAIQTLYMAGRASLMPILAEIEASGELERLRIWGSLMMRYGVAIGSVGSMTWALIGGDLLAWFLPAEFAPVHQTGTVILLGVTLYACAAACQGLLYIRGLATLASGSSVVYTAVTIVGVLLVLDSQPGASFRVAGAYALAAAVFFASAYLLLGRVGGLWLPLRRTALLLLPAVLALPASEWQGAMPVRLTVLIGFVVVFVVGAGALRLLPVEEFLEVWRAVVSRSRRGEFA